MARLTLQDHGMLAHQASYLHPEVKSMTFTRSMVDLDGALSVVDCEIIAIDSIGIQLPFSSEYDSVPAVYVRQSAIPDVLPKWLRVVPRSTNEHEDRVAITLNRDAIEDFVVANEYKIMREDVQTPIVRRLNGEALWSRLVQAFDDMVVIQFDCDRPDDLRALIGTLPRKPEMLFYSSLHPKWAQPLSTLLPV